MPGISRLLLALFAAAPLAAHAGGASLIINGAVPVVIGEVDSVPITLEAPEDPDSEGRPLQASVSVGSLDPLEKLGRGRYRTIYRLPKTKFPQAAVIALWRETGPDADVEFLRLPLYAKTKLPYRTKPGAEVRVQVEKERFGPVTADKKGQAMVPIIVPPGTKDVVVSTGGGGDRQQASVAVKVPPYNRLMAVATPYVYDPELFSHVTVHVYYDDERSPPPPERIKLTLPTGEAKVSSASGTHTRFRYRPGPWTASRELNLMIEVEGDLTSKMAAAFGLGRPVPDRILAKTSSVSLTANGSSSKQIRVLVMDKRGLGVPKLQATALTNAGTLSAVKDAGDGYYEAKLVAPYGVVPPGGKIHVDVKLNPPAPPLQTRVATSVTGIGSVSQKTEVPVPLPERRSRAPVFWVGARVGATLDAGVAPTFGVELSLQPQFLDGRVAIFAAAAYRANSQEFSVPDLQMVDTSLTRLPLSLGVRFAFVRGESWRVYAGAGASLVGLAHRIEAEFQDPIIYRRMVPGAEAVAGASWNGVFLELGGLYAAVASEELEASALSAALSLGYRLGVL